jgi:hypothetical protein
VLAQRLKAMEDAGVICKPRTPVDVLMGDARLAEVLRQGLLVIEGERDLARRFASLFEFDGSESFTGGARMDARAARG